MKAKTKNEAVSYSDIKELWECYIDIQTQLLQLRCEDIHIDGNETSVSGNTICAVIDTSSHNEAVKYILNEVIGENTYELYHDYILIDPNAWKNVSTNEIESLVNRLKNHYIDLNTTTNIIVKISPNLNDGRGPLTISEIRTLSQKLETGRYIKGQIDDNIACIAQIKINETTLLSRFFGKEHVYWRENKKGNTAYWIEYTDQYIPQSAYDKFTEEIGLFFKDYSIQFELPDTHTRNLLVDQWENITPSKDTLLEFHRPFKRDQVPNIEYIISEINQNISDFLSIAVEYCQRDQITYRVNFHYGVSMYRLLQKKKNEIASYIVNRPGLAFQERQTRIGIDFNWRTDNIELICKEIEADLGDISINLFDDHRYKCQIKFEIIGINPILERIRDSFVSVEISEANKDGEVLIKLPYNENNYSILLSELKGLLQPLYNIREISVTFNEKPLGKIQLPINDRSEERIIEEERRLSELIRADVAIEYEGRRAIIGQILRVKFPNLFIDINTSDVDKSTAIKELFSKGIITTITPILVGDVEKLSRLKETFSRATAGKELYNENLQNYIFDSSTATPTEDINTFLKQEGVFMRELEDNLLNSNLNKSQKEAIIKTMVAKDLAIIQGPPGTGKSTAIAELIWQLIRQGRKQGMRKERLLLTSETNLAVDNAIARCINTKTNLVKPIRFGGEEKLESEGLIFSIDLMKKWVEEGDLALIGSNDEMDEDDIDNQKRSLLQPLILKNWLSNIANRAFYGMSEDEDEDEKGVLATWKKVLTNPDLSLRKLVFENYLEGCNVVGATCSSIGEKKANSKYDTSFMRTYSEIFGKQKQFKKSGIEFTTVIQDESSKATPAELVLPLVYGEKSVIIGDHKQLPPMLDKEEFESTLDFAIEKAKSSEEKDKLQRLKSLVHKRFNELEKSHFERLYTSIDNSLKGTFNLQYRMHPAINEVIEQFYEDCGGLKCGLITPSDLGIDSTDFTHFASRAHEIEIPGLITPDTHVIVVDVCTPEMKDGTSRVNLGEIQAIDRILAKFESSESFQQYVSRFSKEEERQIGIISFYGKQIKELRNMAKTHNLPIRVSTVDRFQGMERNIIIVSMVRSNTIQLSPTSQPDYEHFPNSSGFPEQTSLGFAESPNRLNVALSRAKRLLIIVGNRTHFSRHPIYRKMYDVIENSQYNNRIISGGEL